VPPNNGLELTTATVAAKRQRGVRSSTDTGVRRTRERERRADELMSLFANLFGRRKGIETPWVTYRSPAGFYTVEHPTNWRVACEGNIVNIRPPDETGAVTVSAFHGAPPVPDFERKLLADTFQNDEALSEVEVVSRNGWTGLRQGFVSPAPDVRAWVAIVATVAPVFVLITANDTPRQFSERGDTYGRILESLRLAMPEQQQGGA
jgi:hypothetical protein